MAKKVWKNGNFFINLQLDLIIALIFKKIKLYFLAENWSKSSKLKITALTAGAVILNLSFSFSWETFQLHENWHSYAMIIPRRYFYNIGFKQKLDFVTLDWN
jgi:hypothetical protein